MIDSRSQFGLWMLVGMSLLATTTGCKPGRVAVNGSVTLDGQPVNEAVILFVPLETATKKTGGVIVDGKYQIAADIGLLPGKYRVEILDDPPHGAPPSGTGNAAVSYRRPFPQHYSSDSPLHAEISSESTEEAEFNFTLKLVPGKH